MVMAAGRSNCSTKFSARAHAKLAVHFSLPTRHQRASLLHSHSYTDHVDQIKQQMNESRALLLTERWLVVGSFDESH